MWMLRPGPLLIVAGCVTIAIGLIASPSFFCRYVLLDGYLARPGIVVGGQIALVAVGALLAWRGVVLRRRGHGVPLAAREVLLAGMAIAIGLLMAAVLAEVGLRLLAPVYPFWALREDAFWEYYWRSNQESVPLRVGEAAPRGEDRYDPHLGWLPRQDLELDGERASNAEGIRGVREYAPAPEAGRRRIVALGDSFTWAGEVPYSQTYTALLEEALPGSEVINLGVHGWGVDQQLLYLRRRGLGLQPELVTLGFYEDDYSRNRLQFRDYAKPRFLLEDGTLRLDNSPVPSPDEVLSAPMKLPRSLLLDLLRVDGRNLLFKTKLVPFESRYDWRLLAALLSEARTDTRAAGARFLLLYIPWSIQHHPFPTERALAAWAQQTGTPFVNMRERFAAYPEAEWPSFYAGHWTPRGHAVAAEALRETILANGLLEDR